MTTAAVEIDCTEPEIKVSPRRTVEIDISDAQPPNNSGNTGGDSSCSRQRRKRSSKMKSVEEDNSASTSAPSRGKQTADLKNKCSIFGPMNSYFLH